MTALIVTDVNMRTFAERYSELEERFRQQAKSDCYIYLPNVRPYAPVDFVFIAMEPSRRGWAKSREEAEARIARGFRNFITSVDALTLHFSIRRFLCKEEQTYHITDISKGVMWTREAYQGRQERYDCWYLLLCDELALVAKPSAKVFAIGKCVEHFLLKKGFSPRPVPLLHYSTQAARFRKECVRGREEEFQRFAATVSLDNIRQVAEEIIAEAQLPREKYDDFLNRLKEGDLSNSRKELIFCYKTELG